MGNRLKRGKRIILFLSFALLFASCKRVNIVNQEQIIETNHENNAALETDIDSASIAAESPQDEENTYQAYHISNSIRQVYSGDMPVFCFAADGECVVVTMGMDTINQYCYWIERIDSNGTVSETKITSLEPKSQIMAAAGSKDVLYLISAESQTENNNADNSRNVTLTVLDRNGTIISHSACSEMAYSSSGLNAASFQVDQSGRLWFYQLASQMIICLAQSGETVFRISAEKEQLVGLISGNNKALFGLAAPLDTEEMFIHRIDMTNGSLEETYAISLAGIEAVYPGLRGMFLLETKDAIYEYFPENESRKRLFSYSENGITQSQVMCVMGTDDEGIVVISQEMGVKQLQIDILQKDIQEYIKSIITIAAINASDELKELVTLYNRSNYSYGVQLKDYGDEFIFSGDHSDALTRFQADLMDGTAGDILDLSSLTEFISRTQFVKLGILEDLNSWIDQDPLIDRNNYTQSVWKANEIDGGLYNIVPFYKIDTVFGRVSEVGETHSCSIEQMLSLGDPIMIYGKNYTWKEVLYAYCLYILEGSNDHIEQVLKDKNILKQVLLFARNYPEEFDSTRDTVSDVYYGSQRLVAGTDGRKLEAYTINQAVMGEKITCIGYPVLDGVGSSFVNVVSLGMCTFSENKEAVWDFFRFLISESVQGETESLMFIPGSIPVYQSKWTEMLQPEILEDGELKNGVGVFREDVTWWVMADLITQDIIDEINLLISQIQRVQEVDTELYQIILEEAGGYIYGRCEIDEAVDHITNRAKIYLEERAE